MGKTIRAAATLLVLVFLDITCSTGAEVGEPPLSETMPPSVVYQDAEAKPGSNVSGQESKTYYVRSDGGTTDQCNGLTDAPYPGNGTNQPCAWDHPFRALSPGYPARIAGGDTLIIATGSYRMGYGAPGSENLCDPDSAFDCYMPPIPGGTDSAHPTRILGSGWDAGCASPPELWGTQRADLLINLSGSSNIQIACLEITDHSSCVESHSGGLACDNEIYPYGDWAVTGLYAQDSSNVQLRDLNIHGLASTGIHAGRLQDWSVENVRIAGNGWVGWDGDIEGEDTNSGTLLFQHWDVEWNGCGETYPDEQPAGCWAQTAGGYGDGVGTGDTGGDWIIEDSKFLHNTSDGLDLLYHSQGGFISLNRVRAEGNAGNQIKVTGSTSITNSLLVGNCAFFEGKPFTYHVDPCRALGNTLSASYTGGEEISIVNSTFYGQGDGLINAGPRDGFQCNGSEKITGRNNIYLGDQDFFDPGDITFLFYQEGCGNLTLNNDYGIAWKVKNTDSEYVTPPFPGANNLLQDPQLTGPFTGEAYGMLPTSNSPAIDAGQESVCPAVDLHEHPRPSDGNGDGIPNCDLGAYEVWPASTRVYLPVAFRRFW